MSSSSALAPVSTGSLCVGVFILASGAKKVCEALLVAPAVARQRLSICLKLSALFLKVETFLTL